MRRLLHAFVQYMHVRRLERFIRRYGVPQDPVYKHHLAWRRFDELKLLRTPAASHAVLRLSLNKKLSLNTPEDWKRAHFTRETAKHLIPLLSSSDDRIGLEVAEIILLHRVAEAAPAMLQSSRQSAREPATKEKLLSYSADLDPRSTTQVLKEAELRQLLNHSNPDVVTWAEGALAATGDHKCADSLLRKVLGCHPQAVGAFLGIMDGSHATAICDLYRSTRWLTALDLIEAAIRRDAAGVPADVFFEMVRLPPGFHREGGTYLHFTDPGDRGVDNPTYDQCHEERVELLLVRDNGALIAAAEAELRRRGLDPHPAPLPFSNLVPPPPPPAPKKKRKRKY